MEALFVNLIQTQDQVPDMGGRGRLVHLSLAGLLQGQTFGPAQAAAHGAAPWREDKLAQCLSQMRVYIAVGHFGA